MQSKLDSCSTQQNMKRNQYFFRCAFLFRSIGDKIGKVSLWAGWVERSIFGWFYEHSRDREQDHVHFHLLVFTHLYYIIIVHIPDKNQRDVGHTVLREASTPRIGWFFLVFPTGGWGGGNLWSKYFSSISFDNVFFVIFGEKKCQIISKNGGRFWVIFDPKTPQTLRVRRKSCKTK